MKRLMILLLSLSLLLSGMALAEDRDPIVGAWYFIYDKSIHPEFAEYFEQYEIVLDAYLFFESGAIRCLELTTNNNTGTPKYTVAGKWEKNGNSYKVSIISFGEGEAFIEDDCLLIPIQEANGVCIMMRKLTPFNPYTDYVFR